MRHRSRSVRCVLAALTAALTAATAAVLALGGATLPEPPGAEVIVRIEGLRSRQGQILACLTARAAAFPDCSRDRAARRVAIPTEQANEIDFGRVPAGSYAVAIVHDENGNGRADMVLAIPREGFGFSNNAPARFAAPSFARAAMIVGATPVRQTIRIRYIL